MSRSRWTAGLLVLALGLAGCAATPNGSGGTETGSVTPSRTITFSPPSLPASADSAATIDPATQCFAYAQRLSLAQQVGQLYMTVLMAGSDVDQAIAQISASGNGAVILLGNRTSGLAAVQSETQQLQDAAPGGIPLLIATDQEGGLVQKLSGPGFATIPAATEQAQLDNTELRGSWQRWGRELRNAGVNWNLAPVADVVPADQVANNAAIGQLDRGYGSDPEGVGQKVAEVIGGLSDSRVASSAKHFPGLGRVNENTDFAAGHDRVSQLDDADLASFQAAINAGASSVMVSSAIYDQVDPDNPAVFSSTIVTGILRERMGFGGVVTSDDLGAAVAVAGYPVADRGLAFLRAGGDVAVVADSAAAQQMVAATLAAAQADPQFASEVTEKAARVLDLKTDLGLMNCAS